MEAQDLWFQAYATFHDLVSRCVRQSSSHGPDSVGLPVRIVRLLFPVVEVTAYRPEFTYDTADGFQAQGGYQRVTLYARC